MEAVRTLFEKIKRDPRHCNVNVLKQREGVPAGAHRFAGFPMYWLSRTEVFTGGPSGKPCVEVLRRVQYESTMKTADPDAAMKEVEDIAAAAQVGSEL